MIKANPHLKDLNLQDISTEEPTGEDDHLFSKVPPFFKIARLRELKMV